MFKCVVILFCALLFFVSAVFAGPEDGLGGISGKVMTFDGQPAAAVTISIKGPHRTTVSDDKGNFVFRSVTTGSHQLEISLTGYQTVVREIEVEEKKVARIEIQLAVSRTELEAVTVSARSANKINTTIGKTPLKNLENPQVYNSVSLETMRQQAITSFDDVIKNVPGISRTWESTGRATDGASYFALRGFEAQPSLFNGLPALSAGDVSLTDVQEVQVFKGPSGTLFGANFVGYGGIINVVTKKPFFGTGGEVSYTTGSFGLNQVAADVNLPLSKTEKLAMRLNTSYSTENSFQDAGFKKSFFLAPAITYQASDDLTINVTAEILQQERAIAPIFFQTNREDPLTFKSVKELNLDPHQSFTSNELTTKNPRFTFQGEALYHLNKSWTSQTAVSSGATQSLGYYGYIYGNAAGSNLFDQYISDVNQTVNTTDFQENINGDVQIAGMRHRILFGLDYFRKNVVDNSGGSGYIRQVTPQGEVSDPDPNHPVHLTRASVDSLLAGSGTGHSEVSNSTYAAYVSDVVTVLPGVDLLASLRADEFVFPGEKSDPSDDFKQFALSPKFGIVYQPVIDQVSLFANYQNSFLNVASQTITDPDGSTNPRVKSFRPEHANQLEFGAKVDLMSGKLTATASYYDIRVENKLTPLVSNPFDYDQRGKVRSRGFELDVNATPANGVNILAGYSHNHIENSSQAQNETDFYTEKGRAPGGQGPQDLVNLWINYKVKKGALKNFGIGAGGNYAGEYKVIDNSVTGVFALPSYTVLNSSLFYSGDHFRLTLTGNNLLNQQYYIGYWSINPQRPISYNLSIAMKF